MRKSAKMFNGNMIKRDFYLQKIKNRMHNGMIKVIEWQKHPQAVGSRFCLQHRL